MKVREDPRSGKRGKVVAFKSRYGQCERENVPRKKPFTAGELRSQGEFGESSSGWNDLSPERVKAWNEKGKRVRSHPSGEGQCGRLTGQAFYTGISNNQKLIGQPPILDPPERPVFGPNPVEGLVITAGGGELALKLRVSNASVEYTLVFGAKPCNKNRNYCDKFVYLGRLPTPEGGWSDITEQYVKRFGALPAGKKVIIGTLQQMNGWRDVSKKHPKRAEALVPGEAGLAGQGEGGQGARRQMSREIPPGYPTDAARLPPGLVPSWCYRSAGADRGLGAQGARREGTVEPEKAEGKMQRQNPKEARNTGTVEP